MKIDGSAFHLERRVGGDASAVRRIAHDHPAVALKPDFHDADAVRVRSFAIERRVFRRDPISYALETDWPVGAAGFEPLHLEIRSAELHPA